MNSESRFPVLGAASQKTKTISCPLSCDRHAHHPVVSRRRFIGGGAPAPCTRPGGSLLPPRRAPAQAPDDPPQTISRGGHTTRQTFPFRFFSPRAGRPR